MMDEYLLVNNFLGLQPITKNIELSSFNKIPLASLISYGGEIGALAKTLSSEKGLYKAFNPKTGKQIFELPYNSKQMLGAKVGSIMQANGLFDQAAFVPAESITAVNPAIVAAMIAIALVVKKLESLEEKQNRILNFLETDKKTQLEGTFNYLLETYSSYKFNWNNDMFKQTAHGKVHDAKQQAEQDFLFYKEQLNTLLSKKKLFSTFKDIEKNTKEIFDNLQSYRTAIYLYSFASLLEALLLDNYSSNFLSSLSSRIRSISYEYSDLYSKCYTILSEATLKTIDSSIMTGIASATKIAGNIINKIPVIERGPLDEALISAGENLDKYRIKSADEIIADLPSISNPSTSQFSELIDSINRFHNSPIELAVDEENLYVKLAG